MATKIRLVDRIAAAQRKATLTGTEEILIRDGANQKKTRASDIADHTLARAGTVGAVLFAAENSEEAAAAIPALNAAIEFADGIGQPGGACELDGSGKVPAARIPTNLAAYQAASAFLTAIVTFMQDAQTGGVDSEGNPIPLAGYWTMDDSGVPRLVPPPEMDMGPVNAAIQAALNAFTVDRDLDDMLTATEGHLAFMPVMSPSEMRAYVTRSANPSGVWDCNFFGGFAPLLSGALGTGSSIVAVPGEVGHPGMSEIRSGTSSGGGYKVYGYQNSGYIKANARFAATVKTPASFSGITILVGFTSSSTLVEPANGIYFWLDGSSTVTPKCAASSTRSSGSTYTLAGDTWYTLTGTVDPYESSVLFEIIDGSGAVVSTSTVTSNIPLSTGQQVGPAIMATSTDTSGALRLLTCDHFAGYMSI